MTVDICNRFIENLAYYLYYLRIVFHPNTDTIRDGDNPNIPSLQFKQYCRDYQMTPTLLPLSAL